MFSESCSRYVLEVKPENVVKLTEIFADVRFAQIGKVCDGSMVVMKDAKGQNAIAADIADLKEVWQKPLRW